MRQAPKKRKGPGGKRPGAGRPCAPTVKLRVTILRETYTKLVRMCKLAGYPRRKGAPPYFGRAIDKAVSRVHVEEPEYLQLAREAHG